MPLSALPNAEQLPSPEAIHRLAGAILQRHYYDLNAPENVPSDFLLRIIKFIEHVLDPITDFIRGLFDIAPVLGWLFCLLLAALAIFLIVHIVLTLVRAAARREEKLLFAAAAQKETAQEWEARARLCGERGDMLGAVRALLRAAFIRLQESQQRIPRRGATNREWLTRFRGTPLFDALRLLVFTVDDRWYGDHLCTPEDYQLCLAAHASIVTATTSMARPHAQ